MTSNSTDSATHKLITGIKRHPRLAVAVSGGIDSMLLSFLANKTLGQSATMFHAKSSAVPPEATNRIEQFALRYQWHLEIIDAEEFADSNYINNPSNRCYYCKHNLYRSIRLRTNMQIASGANLDDLNDYRPGLNAAEEYTVIHPYINAQIDKAMIRQIAAEFSLDQLVALPASPCLASRVETGIKITTINLERINLIESYIRKLISAVTVRCRIRKNCITIELDKKSLEFTMDSVREDICKYISKLFKNTNQAKAIDFQEYNRGSAFLR